MSAAPAPALAVAPRGALAWLRAELAPSPGRATRTLRLVAGAVLVTLISMSLRVPEVALSVFFVFFVSKATPRMTKLAGVIFMLGVTIAIAEGLFLYRCTFEYPLLRVLAMAGLLFTGMFAARALVIGPLGLAIGLISALTQSTVDGAHTPEIGARESLWLWIIVIYPILVTLVTSQLGETETAAAPPPPPAPRRHGLFVADAFSNPAYARYACKVTFAAMTCYFIYTLLDWPGIHTSFITCCILALETAAATIHKAALRLIGCAIGALLAFVSILYLIPRMETIVSLVLLVAAGSALAGWIATGSERIAYAGLQIAFAFFLGIFQGFGPGTDFDVIRDRFVGIVLGIAVMAVTFRYLWPEPDTAAR